jgi:hypothetical protein
LDEFDELGVEATRATLIDSSRRAKKPSNLSASEHEKDSAFDAVILEALQ